MAARELGPIFARPQSITEACHFITGLDRNRPGGEAKLGWQDYSPEARGMKAALPFIDLFAPAHNLESLVALEPYLARL